MTDTVQDYPRFTNFESYILKNSLKEINEHTTFNVTYDKVKKGRSIDSIVFHIMKKRQADDNSYKLEDETYKGATAQNKQIEILTSLLDQQ